MRKKLISLKDGQKLVKCLESGLKCITLGTNLSLLSAVLNDFKVPNMNYAQELYVLSQPGDVFFGISTSGNATNVYYAALTAKTLGLTVILLTGESGGKISEIADITIRVPETETYKIQELHVPLYHCLCQMLEACFFHK
ncbi:TPA: SIS domain-containing protein [Candidatus Bathyarchaeota archaeon]|nr:SIS domain-containing protein [Candidatus Bathyarchaeota archaeon]